MRSKRQRKNSAEFLRGCTELVYPQNTPDAASPVTLNTKAENHARMKTKTHMQ